MLTRKAKPVRLKDYKDERWCCTSIRRTTRRDAPRKPVVCVMRMMVRESGYEVIGVSPDPKEAPEVRRQV